MVTFSPNKTMAKPEITTGVRELIREAKEALEYWMPRNRAALDRKYPTTPTNSSSPQSFRAMAIWPWRLWYPTPSRITEERAYRMNSTHRAGICWSTSRPEMYRLPQITITKVQSSGLRQFLSMNIASK